MLVWILLSRTPKSLGADKLDSELRISDVYKIDVDTSSWLDSE